MITHRPCGACGALVPITGCDHWKPRMSAASRAAAGRRQSEQDRAAVEKLAAEVGADPPRKRTPEEVRAARNRSQREYRDRNRETLAQREQDRRRREDEELAAIRRAALERIEAGIG